MSPARHVLLAASILLAATSARAGEASVPPAAPEIERVRAALGASPLDCDAVRAAFEGLVAAGRRDGDVAAIVQARRLGAECAVQAANAAAAKLPVPDPEIVSWLLRHPEPRATGASLGLAPSEAAAGEIGIPVDCGLLLTGKRIEHGVPTSRVVLTFRNRTEAPVEGHDIVVTVNGQTWRSIVLPRGEAPPESPLGAPDQLRWDGDSASWVDRRQTASRSISFPAKKDFRPLTQPVSPGTTFDIVVRVEGLAPGAQPADLDVRVDSCVLR